MKIGILQCCSVLAEFQERFGDYPDMFKTGFLEIDPRLEFRTYDIREHEFPTTPDECDAYITTGSRSSTYEDLPWIPPFKALIEELHRHKRKLVGVCFGHQLIADALGGYTELSDRGWGVGISCNQIVQKKSWMQPPLEQLNIVVSHQDQVTELPTGAELIATSAFCPNFMFQIGEHILTIQGHPEFSKAYSETLMRHRAEKLGEATLQHGLNSLELDIHDKIMMRWILNFFQTRD